MATLGKADDLGDRLAALLKNRFGWNEDIPVHGIGDGAKWIREQLERVAGSQAHYLIDMYHLSSYLSNAIKVWNSEPKEEVKGLIEVLKQGLISDVLASLKGKAKTYPESEELRACVQYIENRPGQFAYDKAIALGLPIGSGKVESTHRHLVQKRLKKPGAWWLRENAETMVELRVLRANGDWDSLWSENNSVLGLRLAA